MKAMGWTDSVIQKENDTNRQTDRRMGRLCWKRMIKKKYGVRNNEKIRKKKNLKGHRSRETDKQTN